MIKAAYHPFSNFQIQVNLDRTISVGPTNLIVLKIENSAISEFKFENLSLNSIETPLGAFVGFQRFPRLQCL